MSDNPAHKKIALGAFLTAGAFMFMGCEQLNQTQNVEEKAPTRVELIERDVEAPDVFDINEAALWDGRPSLGGVWVAHPDVTQPERVIIRNTKNKKFVIGALFRRQREFSGPRMQLSSDAADTLGILAGQPTTLQVTALRRQTVETTPPKTQSLPEVNDVQAQAIDPITQTADAAISASTQLVKDTPKTNAKPKQKPKQNGAGLAKPYIQIGIFSIEQNAKNTAESMRQLGIIPIIKKNSSKGKTFWRVVIGPAASISERSTLLQKVRTIGFEDAYAVSG